MTLDWRINAYSMLHHRMITGIEAHHNYNHSFLVVLGAWINTFRHAPTLDNHCQLKHAATNSNSFQMVLDVFMLLGMLGHRRININRGTLL